MSTDTNGQPVSVLVPNNFASELGVRHAIAQLKDSGDWPAPKMPIEEAACNIYVLAVFGQYPEAFNDYLAGRLKTTL